MTALNLDATTASKIAGLRRRYRTAAQLDAEKGIIADENGAVSVDGQSYFYNVRLVNGTDAANNNTYGHAFPVMAGGVYMDSEQVGTEVWVGMIYDGQLGLLGTDRTAIITDGRNPRASNVNSPYRQFNYMKDADLFNAVPLGTQQTQVMETRVEPTSYIDGDGIKRFFPGGKIDLAGDVPAADGDGNAQHLISAVFVNTSDVLESVTSTAKLLEDVLTWGVDVVEAFGNRSARAIPIRFYNLYTGHVLLSKVDDFGDGRDWVSAPKRQDNFTATIASTVDDDIDLRYEVGSWWFDITNDRAFVCLDSSDGAAIWNVIPSIGADTFELKEIASDPTPNADYWQMWSKSDNKIYAHDGDGDKHVIHGFPTFKSYTVTTQGLGANPDIYAAGYYDFSAADANLTQANLTQTHGTANVSYAAHAFIVAAAAGTVDAGVVGLKVTGISITDLGVRNAADEEVLLADITAAVADTYYETSKKWLGQVTYTLYDVSGSPVNYNIDVNYGVAKYEDFSNNDFDIDTIEAVGLAGANDTTFDIKLLHHKATGWTYSAAAFTPVIAANTLASLVGDHSTDDQLLNAGNFAWKHIGLDTAIDGSGSEGLVIMVTSSANNAVEYCNIHIGVEF